jgi:hypothetical protein
MKKHYLLVILGVLALSRVIGGSEHFGARTEKPNRDGRFGSSGIMQQGDSVIMKLSTFFLQECS